MIDFLKIGRRMPRRRDERGWVKKVGKIQRMWEGYFNVYVRMEDGTEKRLRRSRILGPCAEMSKNEAMDELRKIILRERGLVSVVVKPITSAADRPAARRMSRRPGSVATQSRESSAAWCRKRR